VWSHVIMHRPETDLTAYPNYLGEEASVAQDLRGKSPSPARRLIALTRDAALAKAVEDLANEGVDICVVANVDSLSDELLHSSSAIALVDTGAIESPIGALVDALANQFPDLRLLVAGHSTDQTQLASRIANQKVFRFVHLPASTQRLKLFVDAAGRPFDPQRVSVTQTFEALRDPALPKPAMAKIDTALRGGSAPQLAIIGGGIIAAIALGAWLFWPKGQTSRSPDRATQAATAAASNSPAAALVLRADQAFAASRFAATDGTSAAELYRDALKLDPKDSRATSGYNRSIDFAMRGTEEALTAGRIDEAEAAAETLRLLTPNNSRLTFIQTQIARERERANADSSQRLATETRQTQVRASLTQMNERLRRGALLDPNRDSAVFHFRAAEAVAPGDPAVRGARDDVVAALLNGADADLSARRLPGARRLIDAAAGISSGAPGIDVLRRRLDEVTSQAAATAAAAVAAAALPAANQQTTPVATLDAAVPTVVQASSLTLQNRVTPQFPQRALDQMVSGWVDLEFTVATDGSVRDIVVVAAEPRNTFNSAATAAMRRWRFAPVTRDGAVVEQRARQRIRFTAQEGAGSR
jgi:TonB family protein